MAHISRPFQLALGAVAVLALIWVVALHRPSSGSSGAKSSAQPVAAASTPAKTPAPHGSSSAAGKSGGTGAGVYRGPAPGVEGLTRAIAKAHGAVAASQQNAKQLEEKSAQASGASTAQSSDSATAPALSTATKTPAAAAPAKPKAAPHHAASAPALANQHLVEAQLKHGKVVALLFWSSKGSDDIAVRNALRKLTGSDHRLAVHMTAPDKVASFGSITRGVQVYGTPTILIVGKHGRTIVLTGLQDGYAIQQAVKDARHA